MMCPFIEDPVRGSNGVTYANSCTLDVEACVRSRTGQAALTQVYSGESAAGSYIVQRLLNDCIEKITNPEGEILLLEVTIMVSFCDYHVIIM